MYKPQLGLQDIIEEEKKAPKPTIEIDTYFPPQITQLSTYDPDGCSVLTDLKSLNFRGAQTCVANLLDVAQENHNQTKEILAYHVQGNFYLFKKNYELAIDNLERALDLAKNQDNHLAMATIGFDLIKVHHIQRNWSIVYKLLKKIEHIYQELDLVDEKIYSMLQLSSYYREFGNLQKATKLLNLARNLHSTFAEFSNYNNKVNHYIYIKLSRALLEKKEKNFQKAIELAGFLQKTIEETPETEICKENRFFYQSSLYILLMECYLEIHHREKSFATLNHIKKFLEVYPDIHLRKKHHIFKSMHEFFFEQKHPEVSDLIDDFKEPWSEGEIEFTLDQILRVLHKFDQENSVESNESLVNYYQKLLNQVDQKIPDDLSSRFREYYEFTEGLSLKASSSYQMKKFIEFSRELICEYNIEPLCQKSLDMVKDFTKMNRGFVLLFDSTQPRVAATDNVNPLDLTKANGQAHSCYLLVKTVAKTGHCFIKSGSKVHDLFQVAKKNKTLLKGISSAEIIVLPLMVNGDPIGAIYLDSPVDVSHGDLPIDILENLSSVMGFAMNNTYHHNAKETDLKSVKKLLDKHKNELSIQKFSFESFIGISDKKRELFDSIRKSIDSNATITLTGESGVGKEMISKMIHYNSPRRDKNFVALNCAAIPENLLESELFGYVKGAFTDAHEDKTGLFMQANGGTLFLDEIGEMPLSMQVKIIRALQEREVVPVGGSEPQQVDVRIICATNRNLEEMVKDGSFREDLYYRIHVVNIRVPSLKERRQDVPLLVDHALRLYSVENNVPQKTISSDAMKFLMHYSWPGNVRELINVMYNLSIFVERPSIELKDLEDRQELFRMPVSLSEDDDPENVDFNELSIRIDDQALTLSEAKQEFERLQIQRALSICNGQITSASYHLQMPRPQVSRLVKKYGLKR